MALSADEVIAQFHRMIAGDGSSLALLGIDGAQARVRYSRNGDKHCETCVLTPEDLEAMLLEAFERNQSGIDRVEIV